MPNDFRNRRRRGVAIRQAEIAKFAAPYGYAAEGARAFRGNHCPMACPYPLTTREWRAWMAGWQAQYDRRYDDGG